MFKSTDRFLNLCLLVDILPLLTEKLLAIRLQNSCQKQEKSHKTILCQICKKAIDSFIFAWKGFEINGRHSQGVKSCAPSPPVRPPPLPAITRISWPKTSLGPQHPSSATHPVPPQKAAPPCPGGLPQLVHLPQPGPPPDVAVPIKPNQT